jgi:hypothetical protein
MPLSAVDTISVAFEHTKRQLFRPFRFGQWLRLAVLGVMTGELSSGGGCDPRIFSNLRDIQNRPSGSEQFAAMPHIDPHFAGSMMILLAFFLLLLCAVILIWMYVGSVLRFVLIESIVTRRVELRNGWHRWRAAGRRFFLWRMVFQFAVSILFAILLGVPLGAAALLGWFSDPGNHRLPIALAAIFVFLLFLVFALAAGIAWLLAKDFMAPIMALENLDFADSWSRLLGMLKADPGGYAAYVGMKIVLNIAAAIIFGIIIFLVTLMIAIPFGLFGVLAVIAGKTAGLSWDVGTITLAIVAGTVFFAVLMFVNSMVSVPLTVYFPAYAVYFFASRYPRLDAWLNPPPVPAISAVPPPVQSPPLPLDPEPLGS